MGGAKNCPETPRQKMIGMMYLVLTAMLALNVSADILKGFSMVNQSLNTTIETTESRNATLIARLEYLNEQNPEKIGNWLKEAQEVREKSNELYDYIQNFKIEMIKIADGKKYDPQGIDIKARDNTDAASNYAINQGNGKKLKTRIDEYRVYIEGKFDNKPEKVATYNKIFSTENEVGTDPSKPLSWEVRNFDYMPLSAVVTMLAKYQADIKAAETDLLQYFTSQTDAQDFKVNKIGAVVIPESKNVVKGGQYRASIILSASDSTASPIIKINGTTLEDEKYVATCNSVGNKSFEGVLIVKDPVTGEDREYAFKEEYTVVEPSVTIANQDMNVVYMGYNNRISISVPGVPSDQITATSPNATLERTGNGLYICKPKSYSDVEISVTATVDGKPTRMGSSTFRVRTLPDPTAFLKFNDANGNAILYNPTSSKHKLTRANLNEAVMVAEYADGLLQATFKISSFTLQVSDGRGGFTPSQSNGNQFTEGQKNSLRRLKSGSVVFIEQIKVTGAKTTTLAYPSITLP